MERGWQEDKKRMEITPKEKNEKEELKNKWLNAVQSNIDLVIKAGKNEKETKILEKRESKSRPTQGIVTFEHIGLNQRDEVICRTVRAALMMKAPA